MKKTISVLLAIVLLISVLPVASLAADQPAFTDVKAEDWFYGDVTWAAEKGIMAGTGKTEFSPNTATDRATLVLALYHLERDPFNLWKNYFSDIDVEEEYAPAVAWAAGNGIVNGFPDGTFRPEAPITREQLAAMIYRYVQYRGDGFTGAWAFPLQFDDASSVSDWAYESLCWCTMKQIVNGTSEKTLSPKGGATRCQLAAMLRRLTETHEQTLTRADLENAAVTAAWAYYFKGGMIQYDSQIISDVSKYFGGSYRVTENVAPEYGTDDTTILAVCSDYCVKSWYNGTGIRVLGDPLDSVTTSIWENCESDGILALRWVREDYEYTERDAKMGVKADSPLTVGTEKAKELFKDWQHNFRPGDIMTCGGHALLYVGNGYVIDCNGSKYNMETGRDTKEEQGSLTFLHKFEDLFVTGKDPQLKNMFQVAETGDLQQICVVRPSNYLCKDDGDGDLGNDKVQDSFYALPVATSTRQQYPGLEINRTASMHPFNSVAAGNEITYNVKISNDSNQKDFLTWTHFDSAKASYQGEAYKDLPVTETIPAGTELVSAEGAEVKDGVLRWTVDLEPGASKTLSYTVKATAPRGGRIVNGGGFVGKIPSNILETDIGGKKLTEADQQKLSAFAKTPLKDWVKTYNIGDCTPSQFANKIYQDVLGIDLKLPAEKEIYNKLCKPYHLKVAHGQGYCESQSFDGWPGVLRTTVDEDFAAVKAMMVGGYVGGKGMYFKRPETCINEFSMQYLEPGDIIFHTNLSGDINTNAKRNSKSYRMIVVLDATHIAVLDGDGTFFVESGLWAELRVWEAFLYDFFCLFRPSQAYDDIHTLAYDKSGETPMAEAKKLSVESTFESKPLSDENKAKIAAIVPESEWDENERNLKFAPAVYKKAGIDINTEGLQNLTLTGLLGKIASTTKGGDVRGYLIEQRADNVDEQNRAAYRMVLPGYFGGSGIVTEGIDGIVREHKLSDLEIGDIVVTGSWSNSDYIVGVYQGGGKFLCSQYTATEGKEKINRWFTETMDDAAFEARLTDSRWQAFMVLRPSNGFADINNR